MEQDIQIGLVGDEIMYEGQIIRVADEFDAITSKRQYKTHIGVVDTLKILIQNSKPGPKSKKIQKGFFKVAVGKYIKATHLEHIKNEIKRYTDAFKYYEKAEKENKESKKEYYTEYAKGYLIRGEEYEQIPIYLKEAEETYKKRADEIENLRQEYKVIRKLRV